MKLKHSHAVWLMVLAPLLWSTAGVVTRQLEHARDDAAFGHARAAAQSALGHGTLLLDLLLELLAHAVGGVRGRREL